MPRKWFGATVLVLVACISPVSADRPAQRMIRNAAGEPRLVLGEDYYTISETYETPHIAWADPWAGGAVRVLVISPRHCHRETIELAQRLSLDFEAIVMPDKADVFTGKNPDRVWGLDPEDTIREYRAKLVKKYDVIVLANCHWSIFPPEFEQMLLDKLENGTGLVLTYQWNVESDSLQRMLAQERDASAERYIKRAVPVDSVPGFLGEDGTASLRDLAQCVHIGSGRLVKLTFPSDKNSLETICALTPESPRDPVLPATLYDYYQALAVRAVVWAAQKESPQQIVEAALPTGEVKAGEVAGVPVVLQIDNAAGGATSAILHAEVRAWWGSVRGTADVACVLAEGTNAVELALPRLPGGPHFIDVWLRDAQGQTLDWASSFVQVTPDAAIAAVLLDRPSYPAGSTVTGSVRLAGALTGGTRLRIALRDTLGRVLATQTVSATESGELVFPFAFPFPQPVAVRHEIEACLLDDAGLIHSDRALFAESGRTYDDFAFIAWDSGGYNDYRQRLIARASHEWGIDSGYNRLSPQRVCADWEQNPLMYWSTDAGLSVFFYGTYLGWGGAPAGTPVRNPCLSDPANIERWASEMRGNVTVHKHMGGMGYSTGDEYRLSDTGKDVCWSPHCLARLREHLHAKYVTLDGLNEAWQTSFATWDAVVPDTLDQARGRGHYTAWAENRAFSEGVFADIHRRLREVVEAEQQGAPVGEEGMFDADTYFGPDYARFRDAATLIQAYERPQALEHLRSLAKDTDMTGYWMGSYLSRDWPEPKMRWHPWYSLFNDFNSLWWFVSRIPAGWDWPAAFAADLTPEDVFRWTAEEVIEIKRGVGKLILNAERRHDGIAILYSMHSIRAADAHPQITVPIGSMHYPGNIKSSDLAWCYLLEDLNYQYEFVAHTDVAAGLLRTGEFDALVLPTSVALSEGEAYAIREFVRSGGTVFADLWPGVMDEWANILPEGRLDDVFGLHQMGLVELTMVDAPLDDACVGNRLANPAANLGSATPTGEPAGIPVFTDNVFGQGTAHCLNFSINDYFSDWHREEPHVDIRHRPEGARIRAYVAERLARTGTTPPVDIRTQDGEPLIACEAVFFERGDARYLGLLYTPETIHFSMGVADYLYDHFDLNPDTTPVPVTISLPEASHVYDVRAKKYLGHRRRFPASIPHGNGVLFALLPYKVKGVALQAEALQVHRRDSLCLIEPVRFQVALDVGRHRSEIHCARIDVFDPSGHEVKAYGQNVLLRGGGATFTVPFALSDAPGEWIVRASDVASGVQTERTVQVTVPGFSG